jgi:hypothetical protein
MTSAAKNAAGSAHAARAKISLVRAPDVILSATDKIASGLGDTADGLADVNAADRAEAEQSTAQTDERAAPRDPCVHDGEGTVLQAAYSYDAVGLRVLPMKPFGNGSDGKQPDVEKWMREPRLTPEQFAAFFSKPGAGVAVVLGRGSRGVVDYDYDWREAMLFGDHLSLYRPAFGHGDMPTSHRLARTADPGKHTKFRLPSSAGGHPKLQGKHGLMVAELRSNDCYTVFPPSPYGESRTPRQWHDGFGLPPEQDWDDLVCELGLSAFLAVCARFYPPVGVRYFYLQALTGALLRALAPGFKNNERGLMKRVDELVYLVPKVAGAKFGGPKWKRLATESWNSIKESRKAAGMPSLVKIMGLPPECGGVFNAWLGGSTNYDERPHVLYDATRLPRMLDQAEGALLEAEAGLYQTGERVVRPIRLEGPTNAEGRIDENGTTREPGALLLREPGTLRLLEYMIAHVRWTRVKVLKNGKTMEVPCVPPVSFAAHYLARIGEWNLPVIDGLCQTPTLRHDGSLLAAEGYDPQSRLLVDYGGIAYGKIPDRPTQAEAEAALAQLLDIVKGFPFDGNADGTTPCPSRSVWLAMLLTVLIRRVLVAAPFFLTDSPKAGNGKTLLLDTVAIIATGKAATSISQGANDEEDEKRIAGVLLDGDPFCFIDNVERPIGFELLNTILTQPSHKVRVLGRTGNIPVRTNITLAASGNNIRVRGDMVRRTLKCRIDAGMEQPETRAFIGDLKDTVRRDRSDLVRSALIILRAFITAAESGRQAVFGELEPYGSYEQWSQLVRAPLVWLAQPDPCDSRASLRDDDPVTLGLGALIAAWASELATAKVADSTDVGWYTTTQICEEADAVEQYGRGALTRPALHAALQGLMRRGIDQMALGRVLAKYVDRVEGGYRLRRRLHPQSRQAQYSLEPVQVRRAAVSNPIQKEMAV